MGCSIKTCERVRGYRQVPYPGVQRAGYVGEEVRRQVIEVATVFITAQIDGPAEWFRFYGCAIGEYESGC